MHTLRQTVRAWAAALWRPGTLFSFDVFDW